MIEPGTLLQNRYRVARQIGQGGMGAVYFATDERFGSAVAVKQTFFDDPALSRAFEREAQLLNRLRHGALPRVSDHFSEGDGQFLVMEFIEGSDASELLTERGGPLPHADVLRWADELLDALDYLHTQREPVIHRDIKPQNVKLTPRGHAVLLDFGLAKGEAQLQTRATEAASVFGYSRNYAPLEQIQGTGTDARSDIYSLGATLYHLLTGRAPADALTRAGALIKNQPDPLRPAHRANPQVPAPVGDILHRAMALNPALRPRTAAELRAGLRQAAGPNAARRTTPAPSAYTQGRAASAEATLVDSGAQPPDERQTTRLRQPSSLTHSESTVVDGARDAARRPYSYAASSLPEPTEEPARKSPARLLAAAALLLLVACAAVPFVLMQGSTAPQTAPDAQTATSPDAQTSTPDAVRAGGDGGEAAAGTSSPTEFAPAQKTQAPAARTDGEAASTSAQTAPGGGAANEAANAGTSGSGATNADAGQVSTGAEAGRQGLVIHQSAPSPAPADSEEETRRAEELRRAQTQQPQPAGAYYPPPGGQRPPPPDGWRPPPPPRRRP